MFTKLLLGVDFFAERLGVIVGKPLIMLLALQCPDVRFDRLEALLEVFDLLVQLGVPFVLRGQFDWRKHRMRVEMRQMPACEIHFLPCEMRRLDADIASKKLSFFRQLLQFLRNRRALRQP